VLRRFVPALAITFLVTGCPGGARREAVRPQPDDSLRTAAARAKRELIGMHGEAVRARIERGVDQVAMFWRASDGDLVAFCRAQFAAKPAEVDALLRRLEEQLEQIDGHVQELGRSLRWHLDVDTGANLPVDALLGALEPGAHLTEDLFKSGVGFAALLNFPLATLEERLAASDRTDRRQWAEIRLTGRFQSRIPPDATQALATAMTEADSYISSYNLWMHHVVGAGGTRHFARGKRLISHWGLRDEIKAGYAARGGLAGQRALVKVMERIVEQSIPLAVIDDPRVDWNPFSNQVSPAPAATVEADAPPAPARRASGREPDRRYRHLIAQLAAHRHIDRASPLAPTALARAFDGAEMSEERVRALIVGVLDSPLAAQAAAEARRRLGRPLEPHDVWFQFAARGGEEAALDAVTRARYPTPAAFAADIPRILRELGFAKETAEMVASRITVDPSRGAGHAMGPRRRGDAAHLRTRVETGGMDYKGYNIAVHELGHNVEQVFSLYSIDRHLLSGVPSSAFTEALAFLFQAHDLELLGRPSSGAEAERDRVLDSFWDAREIAGAALVELDVWRWLYQHPDASPAELRAATVRIARAVWKRYFSPVLGGDTPILAIYSHSISLPLYLFHYLLGRLIAFQVERHLAGKDRATFAREFERVSRLGALTPDAWMKQATGAPVSHQPLLDGAGEALRVTRAGGRATPAGASGR
jgi:hypothetical protein